MKSQSEKYDSFYEENGYTETILKCDARILWNVKNGKISDLIVEDFYQPKDKQYLYNTYSFDIGNCDSDWSEWELSDVLIKIFVSNIVPIDIRKKIMFELSKIEEFRPDLSIWLYKNREND